MSEAYVFPDQDILHGEGRVGNCFQAVVAAVLYKRLEQVPHFMLLGQAHAMNVAMAWLKEHHNLTIGMTKDMFDDEGWKPMLRCMARGFSPRGIYHACVADTQTGEILHDPHPSRAGLVAIDSYFYFFPMQPR